MGLITIPVFHDTFFWEYPEHYNKYWLSLFHALGVNAAKKSFCIVTPSFYIQKQVSYYTGLPESKIIPVYEAPKSLLHFEQPQNTPQNDLNRQLHFPYLLHVGTFEKRKNLSTLIEAFEQIHQKHPELKLILIGQASPKQSIDDYDTILQLIREKNLVSHVLLPGYVNDDQLHYYYKNAALYVFPSRNEGFGIPVLEAFAYGLPVIIANNSCLPEIAGNAALSFDVDNKNALFEAIETLYTNPYLQGELREKASRRLENFSWEKTATQLKALFLKAYLSKK
jgi:glycosyltransferase involved in cell wall biosynthesis